MTPKEKAKELVAKMDSKQCALIAVDEIRNNVLIYIDICYQWGNYWDEVKEEIVKL